MRYLMMIYRTEEPSIKDLDTQENIMDAYKAFDRKISESGVLLAHERLHPTHSATTVRVREGKVLTFDGPFAETKEQLGGIYLLECKDLDEAIEIATKNPGAFTGSIEIRPVFEW